MTKEQIQHEIKLISNYYGKDKVHADLLKTAIQTLISKINKEK